MHNSVDAVQELLWKLSDIAKVDTIQNGFRQFGSSGEVVSKICRVKADQFGLRKTVSKVAGENRADITHCAGNKDSHSSFRTHQIFQGALLFDQRSSRYRLSRRVSMACQKPSWR